jgi:hypothetical protein
MNKEEIWDKFCEVNPAFRENVDIKLSPDKIRKMVETAYKYGHEEGFERGKLIASKLNDTINRGGGNGMDTFNQIFGGGFKK